jgi:hypothetical protein
MYKSFDCVMMIYVLMNERSFGEYFFLQCIKGIASIGK